VPTARRAGKENVCSIHLRLRPRDAGRGCRDWVLAALLVSSPPAPDGASQLEIRDCTRDSGQPERDEAVGEDRQDREAGGRPEGKEGADHAALDTAEAARRGSALASPDEVGHHDHRDGRGPAESVEVRPQRGDVEAPAGDRTDEPGRAHLISENVMPSAS
jgi:hypothetical protein